MASAAAEISKLSPAHRREGSDVSDRLLKGEKLEAGQSLTSRNGAYTLTLQDDGDGSKYHEIANASAVSDPDLIYPGQVLTIS
jgi:hypothetical protein